MLKAAVAAEGERAGCCGRAELDGIPPLRCRLLLLLLFAHLRTAAGLAHPSRRSPLFSPSLSPEQPGGSGGGRGRAGPHRPPLLLLAPRRSWFGSPSVGSSRPPGPPMAPPRCSCPGSWISRRRAMPGKAVGAAIRDPRVLAEPQDSPSPLARARFQRGCSPKGPSKTAECPKAQGRCGMLFWEKGTCCSASLRDSEHP